MANTRSAKKMIRKIDRATKVNGARRTRVRTFVRKVEEAIASGDKASAVAALKDAEPELARGGTKGVMHKKTASRKISRLTHRVQTM